MSEGWLLAIESATSLASVALARGDHVVLERSAGPGQHHSERLLPLIDEMLREVGIGITQVDAFGISIGPGAFTSLRIGLSTLKGLAFGAEAPVVAVSTLEVLARAALEAGRGPQVGGCIVACLDARRGEVYAAGQRVGTGDALTPAKPIECVYTPAELALALPPGPACLVGEGVPVVRATLEAAPRSDWVLEAEPTSVPTAGALARLAVARRDAGDVRSAAELVPRYVRRAEAEVTRTAQRFE